MGQAAVVAKEFKPRIQAQPQIEDKRLIAYVVPKPGTKLEIADLRAALAATLPEYMVPSSFVLVDSFPLTANGKIDRNALPHPATLEDESGAAPELPRNELERMIAQAWKDAPWIFLAVPDNLNGQAKDLQGADLLPDGGLAIGDSKLV